LYEPIKIFKEPPKGSAHGKEQEKRATTVAYHAVASSTICEGINGDDIGYPEGGESVGLKSAKPVKPAPCQYPGDYSQ
jgi:hypothetical protein